jgi:hypothetical protein
MQLFAIASFAGISQFVRHYFPSQTRCGIMHELTSRRRSANTLGERRPLREQARSGTRVKVPTQLDVEGHYVLREVLEVQAAMLFVQRARREESDVLKLAKRVDGVSKQLGSDRFVLLFCTKSYIPVSHTLLAARRCRMQSKFCTPWPQHGCAEQPHRDLFRLCTTRT